MVIRSKSLRPAPAPQPIVNDVVPVGSPRIIIRPDGSWTFPEREQLSPEDEEVLKRTTRGVPDINYIQDEDC